MAVYDNNNISCTTSIGACSSGPTRALPGSIMLLVLLDSSKLGFTVVENQIK